MGHYIPDTYYAIDDARRRISNLLVIQANLHYAIGMYYEEDCAAILDQLLEGVHAPMVVTAFRDCTDQVLNDWAEQTNGIRDIVVGILQNVE